MNEHVRPQLPVHAFIGDRLTGEPDAGKPHVRFDEGEQGRPALYSTASAPSAFFLHRDSHQKQSMNMLASDRVR